MTVSGAKWVNTSQTWEDETYGILEMDYSALRQPWMLAGKGWSAPLQAFCYLFTSEMGGRSVGERKG